MSFEAESNSKLTVIVPAYQLHFPISGAKQNTQTNNFFRRPGPAYLAVLPVLVMLGPTNFKKSEIVPLWLYLPILQTFAYMTIIVRSMYNFVNCLEFNIRYEKVERPAPVLLFVCVCMEDIQIKYLYKQISLVAYNERYRLIFLRFHFKIVFVHLTHLNYLYLSISYRIQPSDRCGLCSMLR
jgi:hypothetical protein